MYKQNRCPNTVSVKALSKFSRGPLSLSESAPGPDTCVIRAVITDDDSPDISKQTYTPVQGDYRQCHDATENALSTTPVSDQSEFSVE